MLFKITINVYFSNLNIDRILICLSVCERICFTIIIISAFCSFIFLLFASVKKKIDFLKNFSSKIESENEIEFHFRQTLYFNNYHVRHIYMFMKLDGHSQFSLYFK